MFDVRCFLFDVRRTALRTILVAALAGLISSASVFAGSPSVTAVLSNSEAAVGETVELQIKVTGSGVKPPEQIAVDGLEIHQTGTQQHYEMLNFTVSQSVSYNYTILPMKAGKFKIPPQTVKVGGSALRTPELVLNVTGSSAGSAPAENTMVKPTPITEAEQSRMLRMLTSTWPAAASPKTTGNLPAFSTDEEADVWLRVNSPFYALMAKDIESRGKYTFRAGSQRKGLVQPQNDGTTIIYLNPALKGGERVSILIFEMTNAYQARKHHDIDQQVRTGAITSADGFALRHELVEYDGLRFHRNVLLEVDRALGGIPRDMLTWINPALTNVASYNIPLANDYLEAQAKSGHTDGYRKYFKSQQSPERRREKAVKKY